MLNKVAGKPPTVIPEVVIPLSVILKVILSVMPRPPFWITIGTVTGVPILADCIEWGARLSAAPSTSAVKSPVKLLPL